LIVTQAATTVAAPSNSAAFHFFMFPLPGFTAVLALI
jgi:hypothetical protein